MTANIRIADPATLRTALAAVIFGGAAVVVASVAVSPGTGRAQLGEVSVSVAAEPGNPAVTQRQLSTKVEAKLEKLKMPGKRRWSRNAVVQPAVTALSYLMQIENVDDATYVAMRRQVTDILAVQLPADPVALNRAWARVSRDHQLALLAAVSQLGVPYVEGKEEPHVRMDCSGLLWFAWRVAGVDAPRVSTAQIDPRLRIDRRDAKAGDIAGEGKHVHMYLGVPKMFIHAPYSGRLVRLKIMKDSQWDRVAWTDPSNIATYRL